MQSRCDQCKHWRPSDKDANYRAIPSLTLGACFRAIPLWEATEWDETFAREYEAAHPDDMRIVRRLKPEYKDRKIFAQDGSDYRAIVLTTPDFFCHDFEA